MKRLVIDPNTWHYKYFIAIRRFWGFSEEPQRLSLCPYVQTMIWASVIAILCSPFILLGWVLLKVYRSTYKTADKAHVHSVVNAFERTKAADAIETASVDGLNKSFGGTTIATTFVSTVLFAGLCFLVFCLYYLVFNFIEIMSTIWLGVTKGGGFLWHALELLWIVLVYIFAIFFYMMHYIGLGLVKTYEGLAWLVTNINAWGPWALGILAGITLSVAVSMGLWKIFTSKAFKSVASRLYFKLNGFHEARESYVKRQEDRKKNPEAKTQRKSTDCVFYTMSTVGRSSKSVWSIVSAVLSFIWGQIVKVKDINLSVKVKNEDNEYCVLGPLGALWNFLCALKKGVCPVVNFISKENLDKATQVLKQARQEPFDIEAATRDNRVLWRIDDKYIRVKSARFDKKDDLVRTYRLVGDGLSRIVEDLMGDEDINIYIRALIANLVVGDLTESMFAKAVRNYYVKSRDFRSLIDEAPDRNKYTEEYLRIKEKLESDIKEALKGLYLEEEVSVDNQG